MNRVQVLLILLLLIPGIINFATPIYNFRDPTLFGLPFFYWFQIFALGLSTLPYFLYAVIEDRRSRIASTIHDGGR